jgi:hypothetical protein
MSANGNGNSGEGRDEAERERARRQHIREVINASFEKRGLKAPLKLEPPAEVCKPQLATASAATSAEPRKPVVTFLGAYELPPGTAMMVPPLDDDAVAALQETAFETEQRRMRMDDGQPNE